MKEIYLYFYFLINWAPRKGKQKQIYQRQVHKILRKEGSIFPPICSVAENIIFKAGKVKTSLYRLCRNRLCINHSDLGSYSALLPWGWGDGWRAQWYMAALLLGCVEGYKEEGRGAKAFCTTSRWSLTGWLDFVWGFERMLKAKAAPQKWQIRLEFWKSQKSMCSVYQVTRLTNTTTLVKWYFLLWSKYIIHLAPSVPCIIFLHSTRC